MKGFIVGGNKG